MFSFLQSFLTTILYIFLLSLNFFFSFYFLLELLLNLSLPVSHILLATTLIYTSLLFPHLITFPLLPPWILFSLLLPFYWTISHSCYLHILLTDSSFFPSITFYTLFGCIFPSSSFLPHSGLPICHFLCLPVIDSTCLSPFPILKCHSKILNLCLIAPSWCLSPVSQSYSTYYFPGFLLCALSSFLNIMWGDKFLKSMLSGTGDDDYTLLCSGSGALVFMTGLSLPEALHPIPVLLLMSCS